MSRRASSNISDSWLHGAQPDWTGMDVVNAGVGESGSIPRRGRVTMQVTKTAPAPAGMVPPGAPRPAWAVSAPRVRGDGPTAVSSSRVLVGAGLDRSREAGPDLPPRCRPQPSPAPPGDRLPARRHRPSPAGGPPAELPRPAGVVARPPPPRTPRPHPPAAPGSVRRTTRVAPRVTGSAAAPCSTPQRAAASPLFSATPGAFSGLRPESSGPPASRELTRTSPRPPAGAAGARGLSGQMKTPANRSGHR